MTTPSGSISMALEYAAATLADCAAFRTWCGAPDAASARERIHYEALQTPPSDGEEYTLSELVALRPYAIISTLRYGARHTSTSTQFDFGGEGAIRIEFVQDVRAELVNNPAEIALLFYNDLGAILDELCDRAGRAGFLAFTNIIMAEPYARTHENLIETIGDVVQAEITLEWNQNE
jgi:hypothetical protein